MKKTNDVADEVAQPKRSNNKCYASAFRYIQIDLNPQLKLIFCPLKITNNNLILRIYYESVLKIL